MSSAPEKSSEKWQQSVNHGSCFRQRTHRALRWGLSTTPLLSVTLMTQCSSWMAIPHSWMSCDLAEPTRVCSCTQRRRDLHFCRTRQSSKQHCTACVRYLQVVDEQLIEGRVSVEVYQETLVVHHSDSRWLQGNAQTFQLPLTLLKDTHWVFSILICLTFSCSMTKTWKEKQLTLAHILISPLFNKNKNCFCLYQFKWCRVCLCVLPVQ